MKRVVVSLILFYQRALSPLKRRSACCFIPTCSQYALEAVELHGAFRGGVLAAFRVLRCNPFSKGGYDPVPLEKASLPGLLRTTITQRRRVLEERRLNRNARAKGESK